MRNKLSTRALTQVFALWLFLAGIPLFAQGLPVAAPESVGLSQARLDRVAEAVQRSVDEKRIAGAVTLVARRGKIAWLKAQGFLDRESGKAMQPDAIFRICS